jgi:hypothetical protein
MISTYDRLIQSSLDQAQSLRYSNYPLTELWPGRSGVPVIP